MDERTRLRMHSERSVPHETAEILESGMVAHLGFEVGGQPYVIPMLYHFEPPGPAPEIDRDAARGGRPGDGERGHRGDDETALDHDRAIGGRLYLHGSTKSRVMQHLAGGAPVCVAVTHLDQLVSSKTALNHSANYRSAVCFGSGRLIEDEEEKNEILERMVARYFEERTVGEHYSRATPQHLMGTSLVEVGIEAHSGKARRGPPNGPGDDDDEVPGTAGLVDV